MAFHRFGAMTRGLLADLLITVTNSGPTAYGGFIPSHFVPVGGPGGAFPYVKTAEVEHCLVDTFLDVPVNFQVKLVGTLAQTWFNSVRAANGAAAAETFLSADATFGQAGGFTTWTWFPITLAWHTAAGQTRQVTFR